MGDMGGIKGGIRGDKGGGNPYKFLDVFAVAAGAFFSPQKSLFDFLKIL